MRSKRTRTSEVAVVFDCNLFLQAVAKGRNHAYGCLKLVMEGKADLLMSEECLAEIDQVLRRPEVQARFPMLTDERVDDLVAWIEEFAVFMEPEPVFTYPADPKDEPYINLAIAGGAVFLVSWDNHLMNLKREDLKEGREFKASFPTVAIMNPKEFLADFYSERLTDATTKQIAAKCKPIDPIAFRDACEALLERVRAEEEKDPAFKGGDFSPFFFAQRYQDPEEGISACMRFFAFLDLLRDRDLGEFMRPTDDGAEEIHLAVFEAVASIPLNDQCGFSRARLLENVRGRAGEIAAITGLFKEEDEPVP